MKIKSTFSMVMVLVIGLLATGFVSAQDRTWTHAVGGDFFDSNNWDFGVPGPNDDAVFNLDSIYSVELTANATIDQLEHITGSVTILGGHSLEATGWSDSLDSMTLTGAGTKLSIPQLFHIQQNGEFTLEEDTELETSSLVIGGNVGGLPALKAETGSLLKADNFFIGTFDGVSAGAASTVSIEDDANLNIGDGSAPNNTILIEGTNATPEFFVTNGSKLLFEGSNNALSTRIAWNLGTTGRLIIKDSGSQYLQPHKFIYIGYSGEGQVLVQNGGELVTNQMFVAYSSSSISTVDLEGTNSRIDAHVSSIGPGGNGTMNVSNGATFEGWTLNVGNHDGEGNLNVSDPGSTIDFSYVNVGRGNSDSQLSVTGSARVNASENMIIGRNVGSNGSVLVSDLGSLLTVNSLLYLGTDNQLDDGGVADLSVSANGSVVVGDEPINLDGSLIVSGFNFPTMFVHDDSTLINHGDSYVGYSTGSNGQVNVIGDDAYWFTSGDLHLGMNGQGAIEVSDGFVYVDGVTHINSDSSLVIENGTYESLGGIDIEGVIIADWGQITGDVEVLTGGELVVAGESTITGSLNHLDGVISFLGPGVVLKVLGDFNTDATVTASSGSIVIEGDMTLGDAPSEFNFGDHVELGSDSTLNVRLEGTNPGEFDTLVVDELITDPGTQISVTAINGYQPSLGDQFLIVERGDGTLIGSLNEGDLVTTIGGVDLFITYAAGDGNDIALYTTQVATVMPQTVEMVRGTHASGGSTELENSDDMDYVLRRNNVDVRATTEFEVSAMSPSMNPNSIEIKLEGAVFARTQVDQIVLMYDYVNNTWEQVDSRAASRFADRTITVPLTGNLSRFVDQSNGRMRTRVRYLSVNPRQQFSSNTDWFNWNVEY